MNIPELILVIIGLSLFEVVSSIDNAIINAGILVNMSAWARRWFLTWGLVFAVFAVRGLLPWLIIWATTPSLGPVGAFTAALSSDPKTHEAIEMSAPILLAGGGIFLVFLFFHWLFLERKNFGFFIERYFFAIGLWFYAVVSILLAIVVWFAIHINPLMAFGAVIGSTVFFITHGFKQTAEKEEREIKHESKHLSDISKILYLEVIDTTFSIDGVLGAFAFTFSVPIILLGNGLGALVVREFTIGNIERVKKYIFLKNGAMYSVFFLGSFMLSQAFGIELPHWIPPVMTITIIGYFFWKSWKVVLRDIPQLKPQ